MPGEPLAPDIFFTELIGVDERTHRAVEDHDPPRQDLIEPARGCQRFQSSPSAVVTRWEMGGSAGVAKAGPQGEWKEPSRVRTSLPSKNRYVIIVRSYRCCQAWGRTDNRRRRRKPTSVALDGTKWHSMATFREGPVTDLKCLK